MVILDLTARCLVVSMTVVPALTVCCLLVSRGRIINWYLKRWVVVRARTLIRALSEGWALGKAVALSGARNMAVHRLGLGYSCTELRRSIVDLCCSRVSLTSPQFAGAIKLVVAVRSK